MRKLQKVTTSINFQLSKPAFLRSCNQSKRKPPLSLPALPRPKDQQWWPNPQWIPWTWGSPFQWWAGKNMFFFSWWFSHGLEVAPSGFPSFLGVKTLRNVEQFEAGNPIIFRTGFPMVSHLCHSNPGHTQIPRVFLMAALELQHHTASTSCANGNPSDASHQTHGEPIEIIQNHHRCFMMFLSLSETGWNNMKQGKSFWISMNFRSETATRWGSPSVDPKSPTWPAGHHQLCVIHRLRSVHGLGVYWLHRVGFWFSPAWISYHWISMSWMAHGWIILDKMWHTRRKMTTL